MVTTLPCRLNKRTVAALLALAIGGGALRAALAQCSCPPRDHVPRCWAADSWHTEYDLAGADEGRIAVVVNHSLYPSVSVAIQTYAGDLQAEGDAVRVATYEGPPEALRAHLRDMWLESIVGRSGVGG